MLDTSITHYSCAHILSSKARCSSLDWSWSRPVALLFTVVKKQYEGQSLISKGSDIEGLQCLHLHRISHYYCLPQHMHHPIPAHSYWDSDPKLPIAMLPIENVCVCNVQRQSWSRRSLTEKVPKHQSIFHKAARAWSNTSALRKLLFFSFSEERHKDRLWDRERKTILDWQIFSEEEGL